MISDSEPRAYMRPLLGERPPGPDVLRSLSPKRPHGFAVLWILPGWPRDGLTNLLISQVSSLLRYSLEIRHTPPTYGVAYCACSRCVMPGELSRAPRLSCSASSGGLLLAIFIRSNRSI